MDLLQAAKNLEKVIDVDGIKSALHSALHAKMVNKTAYRALTGVAVTTKHSGKMEFMQSISTSCLCNPFCVSRMKDGNKICSHCYAAAQLNRFKNQRVMLESVTPNLTEGIITDYVVNLKDCDVFRLEAFGDIQNVTQFLNYYIIAYHNPWSDIALYSKNTWIAFAAMYIFDLEFLDNLIFVESTENINQLEVETDNPIVDKIFSVYTEDFAAANNITINCGARSCYTCQKCYHLNGIRYINELLK